MFVEPIWQILIGPFVKFLLGHVVNRYWPVCEIMIGPCVGFSLFAYYLNRRLDTLNRFISFLLDHLLTIWPDFIRPYIQFSLGHVSIFYWATFQIPIGPLIEFSLGHFWNSYWAIFSILIKPFVELLLGHFSLCYWLRNLFVIFLLVKF